MRLFFSIFTLSILATASSKVINLTDDNYDRLTEGKIVFIKFFAPWYAGEELLLIVVPSSLLTAPITIFSRFGS